MKRQATTLVMVTLMALSIALSGCQSLAETDHQDSLYQQLGERAGIASIVEDLLYRIVEDERINEQFRGIDVRQFHTNLTDQLCEISGGPCTYTGRPMREGHADMNVTDTQFNAMAENLILAMEENDVPTEAQNRLIKKLVPMYPQIRNL